MLSRPNNTGASQDGNFRAPSAPRRHSFAPTAGNRHRREDAAAVPATSSSDIPGRAASRRRFLFTGASDGGLAMSVQSDAPAAAVNLHRETVGADVIQRGYYPTKLPFAAPPATTPAATSVYNCRGVEPINGYTTQNDEDDLGTGAGAAPVEAPAVEAELRDADGQIVHRPVYKYEVESQPPPAAGAALLDENGEFRHTDEVFLVQMPLILPFQGISAARQKRQANARRPARPAPAAAAAAAAAAPAPLSLASISGSLAAPAAAPEAPAAAPTPATAGVTELPPTENPGAAFPEGQIGEMRVHKSGRITMVIGDMVYDVNPGVQPHFCQQLVDIDVKTNSATNLCGISKKLVVYPSSGELVKK